MIILSGTSFAYTPYRFLVYRISITRNTPCSYTITTVVFLSGAVIIRSYFAFFRKVFYTHSRQRLPDPTKSASQLFLCYYFLGRSAPEIQARRYASQLIIHSAPAHRARHRAFPGRIALPSVG